MVMVVVCNWSSLSTNSVSGLTMSERLQLPVEILLLLLLFFFFFFAVSWWWFRQEVSNICLQGGWSYIWKCIELYHLSLPRCCVVWLYDTSSFGGHYALPNPDHKTSSYRCLKKRDWRLRKIMWSHTDCVPGKVQLQFNFVWKIVTNIYLHSRRPFRMVGLEKGKLFQ